MPNNTRFTSHTEEWSTPDSIFLPLQDEFNFTVDLAASAANHKTPTFFSKEDSSLAQTWSGVGWLNPPFGNDLKKWVKKSYETSLTGATVVTLLPVRSNTSYWQEYCFQAEEIRYILGYPRFGNAVQGIKVPIAIVVFRHPTPKSGCLVNTRMVTWKPS